MTIQQEYISKKDPRLRGIVHAWWKDLIDDKGSCAALRRCRTPAEVPFHAVYHRLVADCKELPLRLDALAAFAGLAAHVKEHDASHSIAERFALPKGEGDSARLSGLRFRRLLQVSDRDELYSAMIRALRLVDNKADLFDLFESVVYWGENMKKRWAYEYYSTAPQEE